MRIIENEAEFDSVLKENKSVFVDFYADWCGPCKMVSPVVEKLAGENTDITFVKVNVDDNPEVASRFGIMSIPTLIAFKDGEVAKTGVGYMPEGVLAELVAAAR